MSIKSIDNSSVHRITSGQVLVDLQTAVKELVENSLDAGATNIEVKIHDYGLKAFEVADNGSGISPEDYETVGLKHYTSKLSNFEDLTTVRTFGFRGEALSSLCALSERVTITTATVNEAPMGTILELDKSGKLTGRSKKTARQRGTTVLAEGLFRPLPVRRKEFERNSKREFGKALSLLTAYALVPCAKENKGVRLCVAHQQGGRKSSQLRTDGQPSLKASISSLWGPKQLESLVELDLNLQVTPEKTALRRLGIVDVIAPTNIRVQGLISKFAHGFGRTGSDRQYFFINGRPCNPSKIQKAFNEVYRTFNATQSPFVVADFIIPTDACDINVSPDKRTILIHSENALVIALKDALEELFSPARSKYAIQSTQNQSQRSGQSISLDNNTGSSDSVMSDSLLANASFIVAENVQTEEHSYISKDAPVGSISATEESTASSLRPLESIRVKDGLDTKTTPEQTLSPAILLNPTSSIINPLHTPKPVGRQIQMVLSTSNASWAMERSDDEPPRKKLKMNNNPNLSRTTLRSRILSYAPSGSQPTTFQEEDERDDEHEVQDYGEEEDELEQEELAELAADPDALAGDITPESHSVTNNCSVDNIHPQGNPDNDGAPLFLPEVSIVESIPEVQIPSIRTADMPPLSETHPADVTEGDELTEEQRVNLRALGSVMSEDTSRRSPPPSIEILRTDSSGEDVTLACDLSLISSAWTTTHGHNRSTPLNSKTGKERVKICAAAGITCETDAQDVEYELSRTIDKDDFERMNVIGQFNRGFIVARRRTGEGQLLDAADALDDLFIIDQHAADEKYNFETLQQSTKIESQRLFKPRPLELTAADEHLALDNIDILRNNGFEVSFDANAEPSQGRLKLLAQPVSGNTIFDMKDLEELLHLMQDKPAGQKMVRCSKVRAMFAMRACRKSVMIGMSLTHAQMTNVVRHMGTMDQPWNCPHGRPTMRHLVDLREPSVSALGTSSLAYANARQVNWADL